MQFGTVTAALLRMPHLGWLIDGTAGVGVLAEASYWAREIRTVAGGARRQLQPGHGRVAKCAS